MSSKIRQDIPDVVELPTVTAAGKASIADKENKDDITKVSTISMSLCGDLWHETDNWFVDGVLHFQRDQRADYR